MAGLRSVLLTREGLCASREHRKGRAAAWSLPRSLARCRIWWGQPEEMGDAAQPRRRRRAAPRRTLSEQRTRRAATRRSTSRPANVCLRCIEKPSAVSGDRVRTVALSSMVLPCTASALAMYLRPASRRPAYQSAYVTRRARSRRRTPGQPIDRGDATAVDARRRREAALFEEVRAASPRSLMAVHFLAFRSV